MEIPNNLRIYGFNRIDLGDRGTVFLRYERADQTVGNAEVYENTLKYFGDAYVSYTVKIPRPQPQKLTGVILVDRTSKNRYSVAAYGNGEITTFSAATAKEIIDKTAWLWQEKR